MIPSEPLPGLMMDVPLTTQRLLWRLRTVHGDGRVSTVVDESGTCVTATYREIVTRAERLAAAMRRAGNSVFDADSGMECSEPRDTRCRHRRAVQAKTFETFDFPQ